MFLGPPGPEMAPRMARVTVAIHERLGHWNRQLRPRLADLRADWRETRSVDDLELAIAGISRPVVLIDPATEPARGLRELAWLAERSPGALALFLATGTEPELALLVRELGATDVLDRATPPPVIATRLRAWIRLAGERAARDGWNPTPTTPAESWEEFLPELRA